MQNSRQLGVSILDIKLKCKIKISDIKEKIKGHDVGYMIKKLKQKYIGYVYARYVHAKQNTIKTFWVPSDHKRKRGRPGTRWINESRKTPDTNWSKLAKDHGR